MIIVCPKCHTKFRIHEETSLSSIGQCVQCCRCQTQWTLEDETDIQAPAPALPFSSQDLVEPDWGQQASENKSAPQSRRPSLFAQAWRAITHTHVSYSIRTLSLIGIFLFGLISAFGVSYYFLHRGNHNDTTEMIELTQAVKIILSPLRLVEEGDKKYILVNGQIVNQTQTLYSLPRFKIHMLSADNQLILTRYRTPPVKLIDGGRSHTFSFKIHYTDPRIQQIKVSFNTGGKYANK